MMPHSAGETGEHRKATSSLAESPGCSSAADKQVLSTPSLGPFWGEGIGFPQANRVRGPGS